MPSAKRNLIVGCAVTEGHKSLHQKNHVWLDEYCKALKAGVANGTTFIDILLEASNAIQRFSLLAFLGEQESAVPGHGGAMRRAVHADLRLYRAQPRRPRPPKQDISRKRALVAPA